MDAGRHLNISQFHDYYNDEIWNLYQLVNYNLKNNGVYIFDDDKFYQDFVDFIYMYSYKFKGRYDQ